MIDTSLQKGRRSELVNTLIKKGITDKDVLRAIFLIPRHFFIHPDFKDFAYRDEAFPIDENQTISQPYTVAFQTQLLKIKKNDNVLEVGTGSGYQTSILVFLKANVYTFERIHKLYRKSKSLLNKLKLNPKEISWSDGYDLKYSKEFFDKILVTAACEEIPTHFLELLKVGGEILLPLGKENQKMTLIKRDSKNKFLKKEYGNFSFVPFLKNKC